MPLSTARLSLLHSHFRPVWIRVSKWEIDAVLQMTDAYLNESSIGSCCSSDWCNIRILLIITACIIETMQSLLMSTLLDVLRESLLDFESSDSSTLSYLFDFFDDLEL
jgi:hypothetical protein